MQTGLTFKHLILPAILFHLSVLFLYGLNHPPGSGLAHSYLARAEILYELSDYDSLPWYYSEALKISAGINDTADQVRCYLGFAEYYRLAADYGNASEYLEKANILLNGKIKQHCDLLADMKYIRGKILAGKGAFSEALASVREASAIYGAKDRKKNARYLNYMGNIYNMTGDIDSAEYYFRKSYNEINLFTNGPAIEKAWYFVNISRICNVRGEYDAALNYLKKSIVVYNEIYGRDHPDLIYSYLNLGFYFMVVGSSDSARFYLDKTKQMIQADSISGRTFFPALYECYGILNNSEGDYLQALRDYDRALESALQLYGAGNPLLYRYYNNCANGYYKLDDFNNALKYYNKAAETVKNMHPSRMIESWYNLATTYASAGQPQKADYYYKKLIAGRSEYSGPGNPLLSYDYLSYGDFLTSEGRYEEAKKYLETALQIRIKYLGEKHWLTSEAYMFLGRCHMQMKDPEQALNYFQNGLISVAPSFMDMDYRSNPAIDKNINLLALFKLLKDKALTLEQLAGGRSGEDLHREYLDACYHACQLAVDVMLRLQNEWFTEESRLYLSQNENGTFLSLIRISLDLYEEDSSEEYLSTAFETAEEMKYSSLLAVLREQKALEEGKVPDEIKNLDNRFRQELTAYNELVSNEYKKEDPDSAKIRNWNQKIYDIGYKRERLIRELSKKYPEYYNLKYFPGIMKPELIRKKIRRNEILCEYVLSDTMLISFTLNRKGLDYRRNGIDSSFYRDIRIINDFVRKDYFNSPSKQTEPYYQASSELYNFLLGGYQFEENSRLIIVPDGMLTFIPFDILITKPVEGKDHNYGDLDWLIRKYTLSYAYSATLLFQKGPHRLTAGKSMIAFAPFEPGTDINEKDTTRYIPAGRVKLKPLAGSAEEVRAIAGLTGGEVRIGSEASEYGFKKLSPPYRILHLAAHTFINEDDPLHSTLIFSASDEGKEDGMLNVSEIYNLDLKARMVVLSACNTGTGMLKRGEGIMSLARAFFYAGVPSVVMTLWPVSDESCVTLMAAFYQNLMRGESKDAALRNAKLLLIMEAEPIFKHPFYWAGYIVVGERSPVFLPRNKIYFTAGLILAISVTVILFRRRIFRKVRPAENSTD